MVFTEVFVVAVVLSVALRLYLASRQVRHIALNRIQVPAEFREQISLQDHQKAADYSIAKTRLGMLNVLIEATILMGLTLLGGLEWIQSFTSSTAEGILAGLLLIAVVGLIGSVLDLPLAYYKQFVLEQRFGFNRMSKGLFVGDWFKGLLVGALIGGPLVLAVLYLIGYSPL